MTIIDWLVGLYLPLVRFRAVGMIRQQAWVPCTQPEALPVGLSIRIHMIPLDCRRDTLAEQSEAGVLQPEAGDNR